MKKLFEVALFVLALTALSGCIVEEGHGGGWHHEGWHER
jgi:hypothetical protein